MLSFFKNLDKDLQKALKIQLRNLWTHTSTAIEGNTLTLGETAFVLEEGLTISGKPLKDHEEVVGHARAIDLVYEIVEDPGGFTKDKLFELHKAVQTSQIIDVYQPVGAWKNEPNSTVGVVSEKQVVFEYSPPSDVPELMGKWFDLYHGIFGSVVQENRSQALDGYVRLHVSFVLIHPFFDGNGRLARLIANIPVLTAGLPPVIIPKERRKDYIDALTEYHYSAGRIKAGGALLPETDALEPFKRLCEESWQESLALVEDIQQRQEARDRQSSYKKRCEK